MSFLVELPLNQYRPDAIDPLTITSNFSLDNARAMMWMSQLAYETDNETKSQKVSTILARWRLAMLDCINNPPGTSLPLQTACAVVASGHGATIVAFAGTDPLKIHDWITDFTTLPPTPDGSQTGFERAVDSIWTRVRDALAKRRAPDDSLFFTGHSLGGALAIIAAPRAQRELGVQPTAVYTFGNPRPGVAEFAANFDRSLRDRIYRLVHGTDLVATVAPSQIGFRHVGHMLAGPSVGVFSSASPLLPSDNDEPDFVQSAFDGIVNSLRMLAFRQLFAPLGPGWLGKFLGILPLQLRDHVPPNYFKALGE